MAWFSQTTGALSRRKTSYLFLDNPDPADYKYGPADPSVSLSIHQFLFHHSSHSTFDSHNSHTFNFHFLKYYIISSYLFILLDPTNIVLRLSFFFFGLHSFLSRYRICTFIMVLIPAALLAVASLAAGNIGITSNGLANGLGSTASQTPTSPQTIMTLT